MLQLFEILKEYRTGDLVQRALDSVSLNLRDNEFVAILGPSGSGKTTLLNIIGGLDQYDEGDLIINGVSTKKYKNRDWDSYRNHSIGFVFQSYNLIPHQSVLENVELALTISGISKRERRARAKAALEEVGLGDHLHKRPNQLSGGQMQRVAIARALVNDPEILLADEPTGALDSETSVQIMELLKEVAKDRLVVMVTHNPELADEYANRIVELRDGRIISDSNPLEIVQYDKLGDKTNYTRTGMSFLTALSLSFKNLSTKKARTLLTAFAGSIGIIGIALILSLSNGVNKYITDIQRETMVSYPVTIQAQGIDLSGIVDSEEGQEELEHELDGVYSNPRGLEVASTVKTSVSENNLTEFKKYLDDPDSEIHRYVGENGIIYSYDTRFDIFGRDPEDVLVNTNGSTLEEEDNTEKDPLEERSSFVLENGPPVQNGKLQLDDEDNNAQELIPGKDSLVSSAITENYDLVAGEWPKSGDEVVLVLDENNEIPAQALYQLGILPGKEYKDIMAKIDKGEKVKLDTKRWNYQDLVGKLYQIVPRADYFVENAAGHFDDKIEDEAYRDELLSNALYIRISGIIRAVDEDASQLLTEPLGYTQKLTDYIIEQTDESAVVKAQEKDPDVNVLNGYSFEPQDDAAKAEDAENYLKGLGVTEKANMMRQILLATGGQQPPGMDENALARTLDTYLANPDQETLLNIYEQYISPGSYDDNLSEFGVVSLDAPSEINIYADTFEDKDQISAAIQRYNTDKKEEDQITYTDFVGLLMSSVTTIINVITWVLVAFVAVALVVSSIMIGIITYISVLERTREIGILRSIGASKGNISQVFNAETMIIGCISGLLGIGLTLLLLIPMNMVIHNLIGSGDVNAQLPFMSAIVLVLLSIVLTFIGGLIPSRKAAKKDPVTALRSE